MRKLLLVLMCLCLASPLLAQNLIVNPDLETGNTTGWGARFNAGAIQVITDNPHSGIYCLRDYNRTETWHGVWQSQDMRDVTELGVTYSVSAWVRTNRETPVQVSITMQYGNPDPTDGTQYHNILSADIGTEWTLVEAEYTMVDNGSADATFYLEVPGDANAELFVDDVFFGVNDLKAGKPYDPAYDPVSVDGFVGTPFEVSAGVYDIRDLKLKFKAGIDLTNEENIVNPAIDSHYVYLQTGAPDDPNLYLIDYPLPQESLDDPNQSLTLADAGIVLKVGTTYQWQVEMVMKDPNDVPYPAGSPNNILGSFWSFTTAKAEPEILSITDHMLLVDGGTEFTITTTPVANNYRWYKVFGDQDVDEEGNFALDDDVDLTVNPGSIYSETTTKTLKINGAAPDGSDDARVYAVAYNGVPGELSTMVSKPSAVRWFWAPRLVNLYAFDEAYEKTYEVEVEVEEGVFETQERTSMATPDSISGYDMVLLSNDTGDDVPTLVEDLPPAPGIDGNASSLKFNNPRANPADPNNGDTQYGEVLEKWAGAYKDVTISTWVYNNGSSNWNRILDYGNDTNNYMMLCMNSAGNPINNNARFSLKVGGTERNLDAGNQTLPVGEWTHVAATLTGSTARIYINGELRNTATNYNSGDPISYGPATQKWIGRSQWGSGDGYLNGQIDQLKIYNYALTTVEVGQDYLEQSQKEYVCNLEIYDFEDYDTNGNCLLDLGDFASMAARWLEDDRIYPTEAE